MWFIRARSLALLLIASVLPIAAFAAVGGGGTNTTTYTTSTRTLTHTNNIAVNQRVDTFSVELIGRMQGGATLYDQTFNVAYADPAVQAAIGVLNGALTGSGATTILGPDLLSSYIALFSSLAQIGNPVTTATNISATTTMYIGPQTIMVGNNQSQSFSIVAGGIDYDTLLTTDVYQDVTTTTTDTYLTTAIYEWVGVADPVASVPEPGTLGLVTLGFLALLSLCGVLLRKTGSMQYA